MPTPCHPNMGQVWSGKCTSFLLRGQEHEVRAPKRRAERQCGVVRACGPGATWWVRLGALLQRGGSDIRVVDAEHPDALSLLAFYFDELRELLEGYVAPSRDELRADAAGVTLVAYEDDAPVGTGALRRLDDATAEVKRMFVTRAGRRRGHARAMLHALETHARSMGYARIVLDTAAPLEDAARLYLREGYVTIARYNDNPVAARWFEKRL